MVWLMVGGGVGLTMTAVGGGAESVLRLKSKRPPEKGETKTKTIYFSFLECREIGIKVNQI